MDAFLKAGVSVRVRVNACQSNKEPSRYSPRYWNICEF